MTSMVHDVHSHSSLFTGSDSNSVSKEQEMVRHLIDDRFNGRDDALEWLKASILQCDGSCVPFSDPVLVFQGLSAALEDEEWDTRYQCVKVVGDLIPLLEMSDVDLCMHEVLPQMIRRLGDAKITVSMAATCTLSTYTEYTTDIQLLYDSIVHHGLKSDDHKLKLSVIDTVPSLVQASYGRRPNLEHLIASLVELTFDAQFLQPVETCLRKISLCIGMAEFDACINQLPTPMREQYLEIQNDVTVSSTTPESPDMSNGITVDHSSPESNTIAVPEKVSYEDLKKSQSNSENLDVLYGFIPSKIVNNLSNHDDNKYLSQAIEELRVMVSDSQKVKELQPHMSDFIDFLGTLLDDGISFQVIVVTLDVIGIVMLRVDARTAKSHVYQVTMFLVPRMSDPNKMVRRAVVQLVMRLMQATSPAIVIDTLSQNVRHRSPRVRQLTVDMVTAALLTRPRNEFDLAALCVGVAVPALVDAKKGVRHAAMECVAVLAQALGAGKQRPLMAEIERQEAAEPRRCDGLMAAVQARLARRQLPSVGDDGLVEYAVVVSSPAVPRGGVDVDWVRTGSSSSSSCGVDSPVRSDSFEAKPRSTSPPHSRHHACGIAAKSLSRLPWEREPPEMSHFSTDATKFVRQCSERALKQPSPEIAC